MFNASFPPLARCILFLALLFSQFAQVSHAATANRTMDTGTITISGEKLRTFHLHDGVPPDDNNPVILLLAGSGCDDFSLRMAKFFEKYPPPLNVFMLDKPGLKPGAQNTQVCPAKFSANDQWQRRAYDNLAFIQQHPLLKQRAPRSIALLGFSEGGAVAPLVAVMSNKIGWLAVAGAGGLAQSEEFLIFEQRKVPPFDKFFPKKYLLKEYAAIKRNPTSLKKEFFGHPYRYWASHLFQDPMLNWAKLDIPMVVAMGEKDDAVPIESGYALRDYFAKRPEKNFRFIEFPNASHALRTPEQDGAQLFIAELARWFKGDADAFNFNFSKPK
jgi:pimeloyl-ACP methyl ester carboxylesterase